MKYYLLTMVIDCDSIITRSVIMRFFPVDPDDRVIMESQCIDFNINAMPLPNRPLFNNPVHLIFQL